jgi:hypothetical protein
MLSCILVKERVRRKPYSCAVQEFHLHTMERAQQNPKNALLMLSSSQDAQTDSVTPSPPELLTRNEQGCI